jgi:hypothetical protein
MFEEFYKFRENPFQLVPNPNFLYKQGLGDGDEIMRFYFEAKMIHQKNAKTSQNRCPRGIAAHHLPRDEPGEMRCARSWRKFHWLKG